MKIHIKSIVLFPILFLFIVRVDAQMSWQTYSDDQFIIQYPAHWSYQEASEEERDGGILFYLMSPAENEKDLFYENANIGIEKLTNPSISLSEYVTTAKKTISSMLTKIKFLSDGLKTGAGGSYWQLEYTASVGKFNLYFLQALCLKDQTIYAVTLTDTKKAYKKNRANYQQMAASFRVK